MASPWSCPWPSFCSLISSSPPCRLFLNIFGAPSLVRISAPNQLFPLLGWCLTFAARCLTPRSSRAPTAGHAGPAGGTRCIFASRARASHRRCRLNSNVRQRENKVWQASKRLGQVASPWSCPWPSFCSLRSSYQPCRLFLKTFGAPSRVRVSAPSQLFPLPEWCLTFPARCLTPRSRRGPTSKRQARAVGWRILHHAGRAFCCRSRLSSNVRPHTRTPWTL